MQGWEQAKRSIGALGSVAVLLLACGCDSGASVHPFFASAYDPVSGCLGPLELGDVLDGPDPGPCQQSVCWLDHEGHAHISQSACDGPPDWTRVDQPAAGSLCAAALDALARWGVGQCAPEAGTDAEAGI